MAKLPWNVADVVKAELHPGEVVRWLGSPTFFPMLGRRLFQIIFGTLFAAIAYSNIPPVAWDIYNGKPTKELFGVALAMLFIAIAVASVANAFFEAFATSRTAYAVTDRRVLIVSALIRKKVQTFGPGGLNAMEMSEGTGGSGTLTFRREVTDTGEGKAITKFAFVGVRDVATAARAIEGLRLSGNSNSSGHR